MANLTDTIAEIKSFCASKGIECVFTNYLWYVPKTYPCLCVDVASGSLIKKTYSNVILDEKKTFRMVYLDKAPDTKDKEPFLLATEILVKDLFKSPLGDIFADFGIGRRSRDRSVADNLVFIEEIILNGEFEI